MKLTDLLTESSLNENNPKLNKKVKAFLDGYLSGISPSDPDFHHTIATILKGALGDANFHSEAKKVDSLFPKAKKSEHYKNSTMNDVIEDKGVDIAKWAKWDGKEIAAAIGFYVSMTIGRPVGEKVESLVESAGMKLFKESVNEITYDNALADFNKELEKNSEVKKAAKHYNKSVKDVVKVLQQRIKVNRYSDKSIKQISINYTEDGPFSAKVTIKLSKSYKQNESVNEGYGEFIKAKNLTDIVGLSKKKKNAVFYVTDDNNSRIGSFYLKNGKFAKATTANANYDLQNSKTTLRDRSDVIYKYKVDESVVNETAGKEAMGIAGFTATRGSAVQKFIDDYNLNAKELYKFISKGKLKDRIEFATAIAGTPGNKYQGKIVGMFGESVNEVKYDTAIADFNKELEKNSEVKKAAKHYKKSTKDVVKALQSKIKVNRYSDKSIKQISIDYKEDGPLSSKVSIKLSKDYKQNESVNEASDVETYHKTFTSAAEAAEAMVKKRGFEVDKDDWSSQVAMGGKYTRSRPSVGKTNSFTVGLTKGGKPQRKALQFSVYGMASGTFELTAYIN